MLRGSTHYCAIASHWGFSGVSLDGNSEVHLRPTLVQSDEPSDLRGSLSPPTVDSTWCVPGGRLMLV